MKRVLLSAILLTNYLGAFPQEDQWDVYLAQYEKGLGSTLVNMSLKNEAPLKQFPYLLITGVEVNDCLKEGMPTKKEFDNLYKISDKIKLALDSLGENKSAGVFTYQCERIEYYYLKDTTNVQKIIDDTYKKYFPKYKSSAKVQKDSIWDAYLTFLYPNEETYEYMSNQKVLNGLEKEGDNLSKPRHVDHWIYFNTETDRSKFIAFCQQKNFKIENKAEVKDGKMKYSLQISRTDYVAIDAITKITLELRKKAAEFNGKYDGWETIVVK